MDREEFTSFYAASFPRLVGLLAAMTGDRAEAQDAADGVASRKVVLLYAGKVPDTNLTLCRLRATPARLTERVFRRGLGRGPVIPGPPPTASKQQLAARAAEAIREASGLDAADFADLYIDTDNQNVAQVAQDIRTRTGGWPALAP